MGCYLGENVKVARRLEKSNIVAIVLDRSSVALNVDTFWMFHRVLVVDYYSIYLSLWFYSSLHLPLSLSLLRLSLHPSRF